jgi:hypothetical protein
LLVNLPKMPKNYLLLALLTSTTALTGCRKDDELATVTYPSYAEASSPRVLATAPNSTVLYNGGFGSALAPDPNDPTVFYLLTDRGPNAAGVAANSIVFGKADFTPQIGKFRLKDGQLTLEQTILLKNAVGQPLTGLPNPAGQGSTGETALDLSGQPLGTSVDGIDSEGLVLAPDGTFWISDEYGPHIAHFDATGKQLERINPFGSGQAAAGAGPPPAQSGHGRPLPHARWQNAGRPDAVALVQPFVSGRIGFRGAARRGF